MTTSGDREREKHVGWMRVALAVAAQSNCHRAKYGCVILDRGGRVVATGRNGKPAGSCNDAVCYREGLPPDANRPKCCLHSEQNALVFGNYAEYQGGTLYVTGLPCEDCALLIAQSGVKTLVCLEDTRGYDGLAVLERYGFTCGEDPFDESQWADRYLRVVVLTCEELEQLARLEAGQDPAIGRGDPTDLRAS